LDHRSSVRAVRALADGEEAFVSALEREPAFEAAGFESFLTRHHLRDWVAPAFLEGAAEHLVPADFRERLREYRAVSLARNQGLLREAVLVRSGLAEAGLGCLILKGICFGQRFYGDASRRQQGDVDVLVRSQQLEAALTALERLGYDVETNQDDGKPVAVRLREIRGPASDKAPHGVTVRRGELKLDLHWCLNSRSSGRVAEGELWNARQAFKLAGHEFETLSDEDTLAFLLLSLCEDLRRGACRAKHFLDLYMMLRALEPRTDWEGFCERQREQGVLKVAVNVLAVFFALWGCAAEFPGVSRALARRLRLVELSDADEAVVLMERPRGSPENRLWFRRVYPRTPTRYWAWRLTRDLPHTLARLQPSRGFVLPES
jgi:hypothetical protein